MYHETEMQVLLNSTQKYLVCPHEPSTKGLIDIFKSQTIIVKRKMYRI